MTLSISMADVLYLFRRVREKRKRRRFYPANRIYRNRHSFLDLTEEQVLHRYSLDKQAIHDLCEELRRDLESATGRSHAIPVAVKVTSALCFLASGSFQASTGDTTGISQSAMSSSLTQFLDALVRRANQYVCFPLFLQQQQQVKREFFDIAGFPCILGVVDCMHVALRAPPENDAFYRNKKNFHSMNMLVVCDAKCLITNVVAKFPGSCHNAYILRQSALANLLDETNDLGAWILGNSAYPLKKWLMTPIAKPESPAEEKYNKSHHNTIAVIKRTFSILKKRFRCIDKPGGSLQYSPQKVCQIFLACCILHNIALARNIPVEIEDTPYDSNSEDEDLTDVLQTITNEDSKEVLAVRAKLVKNYF
ncbi:putative nuclease HARBI1 [Protopterus annectens]|uniref:putative nuclease HARBI1 n=1 Tax=Protopterus annectens TaxID=7888 RepID=UPI001CF9E630|nr:putative nuclease HARBI1 [Protopterus annectens]